MAHDRDMAEYDVGGFILAPTLEPRQELVAILAAVEEKIDDFDFVTGFNRLLRNFTIVRIALGFLRRRRQRDANAGQPAE